MSISPENARVLLSLAGQEMSMKDIATLLGITVAAVHKWKNEGLLLASDRESRPKLYTINVPRLDKTNNNEELFQGAPRFQLQNAYNNIMNGETVIAINNARFQNATTPESRRKLKDFMQRIQKVIDYQVFLDEQETL